MNTLTSPRYTRARLKRKANQVNLPSNSFSNSVFYLFAPEAMLCPPPARRSRTKLPKKEISQIFLQHLKDTPLYYLHEIPLPHCTQSSHGTGLRKWHLKNLGSPNVSFAELATPNGCPKAITHQHPRTPSDTFPAPFDDSSSIACFATCLR